MRRPPHPCGLRSLSPLPWAQKPLPPTHSRGLRCLPYPCGLRCLPPTPVGSDTSTPPPPWAQMFEYLVPSWWCCLGKFRRCDFTSRGLLFLPLYLPPGTTLHTMMDSYQYETESPGKLLPLSVFLVIGSYHSH